MCVYMCRMKYVCMYVCMYVRMYVCMYVCITEVRMCVHVQGDTDVIACWHRPDMTTTIVDGFNTPADHRFMIDDESAVDESADDSTLGSVPEDVTLIHSGTGIENGTFSCK